MHKCSHDSPPATALLRNLILSDHVKHLAIAAEEPGQYLGPSISATPNCNETRIVQNGDRCWQLWTTYGLSQEIFTSLNPSVNCSSLAIGQPICVSNTAGIPVQAACQLYFNIQESLCFSMRLMTSIGPLAHPLPHFAVNLPV